MTNKTDSWSNPRPLARDTPEFKRRWACAKAQRDLFKAQASVAQRDAEQALESAHSSIGRRDYLEASRALSLAAQCEAVADALTFAARNVKFCK